MEPGGARTKFRYSNAKVAKLVPEYENRHGFLNMLEVSNVRSVISKVSAILLATRSRTRVNLSGIHTNTK